MSELLKCPFCGGEAIIKSICNTHEPDTDDWWVSCRICRVERPSTQKGEIAHTKADAIAAWNRRAQPTMPSEVREAIRRVLHTYYIRHGPNDTHEAVRAWLDAHAQEGTK